MTEVSSFLATSSDKGALPEAVGPTMQITEPWELIEDPELHGSAQVREPHQLFINNFADKIFWRVTFWQIEVNCLVLLALCPAMTVLSRGVPQQELPVWYLSLPKVWRPWHQATASASLKQRMTSWGDDCLRIFPLRRVPGRLE